MNLSFKENAKNVLSYELKKEIICFIDILGFTNLVRSKRTKIQDYLFVSELMFQLKTEFNSSFKLICVSDSILFTAKITEDPEESLEMFRYAIDFAGEIQGILAYHGFWSRGAIHIGDIIFDSNKHLIVGEGFLRVQELEKQAKQPRVIIDTNCVDFFGFKTTRELMEKINTFTNTNITTPKDVIFDYSKHDDTAKDLVKDTPLFVDWINIHRTQSNAEIFYETLHKNLSSDILQKVEYFEKYAWINQYCAEKYFNFMCNESESAALKSKEKWESFLKLV